MTVLLAAIAATSPAASAARPMDSVELSQFAAVVNASASPLLCGNGRVPTLDELEGFISDQVAGWAIIGSSYAGQDCGLFERRILWQSNGTWQVMANVIDSWAGLCGIVMPQVPMLVGQEFGACFINRKDVVLGNAKFAPNGRGWGRPMPRTIDNGGVPSGVIKKIRWKGWGNKTATATGWTYIYKPRGGYYRRMGRIKLRATEIYSCSAGSPPAYIHLSARVVKKPGGRFGRWFEWSGQPNICHWD